MRVVPTFLSLILASSCFGQAFTFEDPAWLGRVATPVVAVGDVTDGLTHRWKFDGNATDSAGSINLIVNYSGTAPTYASGKDGQCVVLDSQYSQYFLSASEIPELSYQSNYTLVVWFQVASATNQGIVYSSPAGGDRNGIIIGPDTRLSGGFYNGSETVAKDSGTPTENTWYHTALVVNSGTSTFYVNNSSASGTGPNHSLGGSSGLIKVGENNGNYFYGKVDDIRVYNRALSSTEITTIYTATGGQ